MAVYEMPAWKSFQIDEFDDLNMAEWLMLRLGRDDDRKLAAIKLLVFDFDGVMTDNRVMVDEHGTESVWCSRADGLGIQRLKAAGIKLAVLSTEKNRVVAARCRKLGIPCLHGLPDKLKALRRLAGEEVLYVLNWASSSRVTRTSIISRPSQMSGISIILAAPSLTAVSSRSASAKRSAIFPLTFIGPP